MRIFFLMVSAFSMISYCSWAQPKNTNEIDSFFNILENNDRFMGVAAIMKGGKIIYKNKMGFASLAYRQRINDNALFQIGSISKTYTATLIMKAVEEQKLKLDDKLSKYFPTIENAESITIEQMLLHKSGINNFTNDTLYDSLRLQFLDKKKMLDYLSSLSAEFEPGTAQSYSNGAFVLLSFILEDIYKISYGELLQDKIAKPLGLTYTYFGGMANVAKGGTESFSYTDSWVKENPTNYRITMGAGGIVASIEDVLLFADALFNGKIITNASLEKMLPQEDGMGYGLFTLPFGDEKFSGHTGGIDGYQSVFGYNQKDKIAWGIVSNGSRVMMNNISIALLSHQYNLPIKMPVINNFSISSKDLDAYVGVYEQKELNLTFHITKENNVLHGRIEGQPSIALVPSAPHTFTIEIVDAKIIFNPEKNMLSLIQNGAEIDFLKK